MHARLYIGYLRNLMARSTTPLTRERILASGPVPALGALARFDDGSARADALLAAIRIFSQDAQRVPLLDRAVIDYFFLRPGKQATRLEAAASDAGVSATTPKNALNEILDGFCAYLSTDPLRIALEHHRAPRPPVEPDSDVLVRTVQPSRPLDSVGNLILPAWSLHITVSNRVVGLISIGADGHITNLVRAISSSGFTVALPPSRPRPFTRARVIDAIASVSSALVYYALGDVSGDPWYAYAQHRADADGKPFAVVALAAAQQ